MFCIKLYIGLSANSISIYSDGINNLFDSLSGLLSVICLSFALKSSAGLVRISLGKTEQLLSFILSLAVGAAGVGFIYSSLERLMYPTPIWFQVKYLGVLVATALTKLSMFLYFNHRRKKADSEVVKVIAFDSLLDTFVTLITILGFIVSEHGTYAVDALCGIIISILIVVSAVKMVLSAVRKLMNIVDRDKREIVEALLEDYGITADNSKIDFSVENEIRLYIRTEVEADAERLEEMKTHMKEKTGIKLYMVK